MEEVMTLEEVQEFTPEPLQLADRCDRCGIASQAFMRAYKFIAGKFHDILLCGHHGREMMPGLVMQGFAVQDETDKINIKPTDHWE